MTSQSTSPFPVAEPQLKPQGLQWVSRKEVIETSSWCMQSISTSEQPMGLDAVVLINMMMSHRSLDKFIYAS